MPNDDYPKVYLYRRIVRAKLFIDERYPDKIDVDNIADEAFFSKFHFIRLFKKAYGKTPHQYLTFVRIEKAKELLQSSLSITDICFSVGFDSVTSFVVLFRRMVGLTPTLYRQEQLKKKSEITQLPLRFVPNCLAEANGWIEKSNFGEAPLDSSV